MSFFKHRLSLVLVVTSLVALLSAGVVPVGAVRSAAGPPHGGSIKYNLGVVLDCADAAKSGEAASLTIVNLMADTLITQDNSGKFAGDLATKWSFSHGGKWITFMLRHGAKFSNGHAVDAAAVRYNLLRPENNGVVGPVTGVKVHNKYQLTLELSAPFRPALANLAFLVPIYDPKSITRNDCTSVVGSGPFKIASVGPGFSSIVFKRNPLHTWNVAYGKNHGPAYLSSVNVQAVNDPATSVSELLTGGLDAAAIAGTQLKRVKGNKNIIVYKKEQQSITWLGFNTKHAPFNNPKVRFAIGEAISRTAVINAALNGQGKPSYSIVPPSVPFSDPSAKKYAPAFKPSTAQKVLAKYHVKGPYTLLCFSGFYATIAEVIQAELAQVGVNVKIVLKSLADYFPVAHAGAFDINVDAYFATDPDFLYADFHSSQETSTGSNYSFYKNKTLDKYIVQGRESVKEKAAAKAYNAAQKILVGQGVVDPLYVPVSNFGIRSRVGGFHRNVWALFPLFQDLYVKK